MCTIMTATPEQWTRELATRMVQDSLYNPDGYSLLLVSGGMVTTLLRTMDFDTVLDTLDQSQWDRFFLHCRAATQGSPQVSNTHGWDFGPIFVMHNGVLRDKEADQYAVDSMVIGQWLQEGGIDYALDRLAFEPFANVLLIDSESGTYTVSRSETGTLYTDYQGNYSTNAVGTIRHPVAQYYCDTHPLFSEFAEDAV